MTKGEWDEVVGWIQQRWPNLTWTGQTFAGLFTDLEDFDAVDVWAALGKLHNDGAGLFANLSIHERFSSQTKRATAIQKLARTPAPRPHRRRTARTFPTHAAASQRRSFA